MASALLAAALMAGAATALAQEPPANLPGFDESLRIWFPPDAPPDAYLNRDPKHSFSEDVKKAFAANPALRDAVCAKLREPVRSRSNDPSAAQLRTLEGMFCLSIAMGQQRAATQGKKDDDAADLLAAWFAEERAAAEKLPPEERRRKESALRQSAADLPPGRARARAGVRMIALRPSDDMAIAFLLEHGDEVTLPPAATGADSAGARAGGPPRLTVSKRQVRQFLTDLYRSMIESEGDRSGPFRSGWAGYLYLTGGDLAQARALAAAYVDDPLDDNPGFETIFVAHLDRLLGNPKPLAALVGQCPFTAPDPRAAGLSANYCRAVSWSLAARLIEARGRDASPVAAEVLREAIRAEPVNWDLRLVSIRTLDKFDPAASAQEYEALAALPATALPTGVRLDAIDGQMIAAIDRGDHRGALAISRRWLDTAGYRAAALPADGWQRLAATPTIHDSTSPCPDSLACVLAKRVVFATDLGDWALARRMLEERLAYTLEEGFPEETRFRLMQLAQTEIEHEKRDDALRIVRYLWLQPKDRTLAELLEQEREDLSPKGGPPVAMTPTPASPWDAERPVTRSGSRTP